MDPELSDTDETVFDNYPVHAVFNNPLLLSMILKDFTYEDVKQYHLVSKYWNDKIGNSIGKQSFIRIYPPTRCDTPKETQWEKWSDEFESKSLALENISTLEMVQVNLYGCIPFRLSSTAYRLIASVGHQIKSLQLCLDIDDKFEAGIFHDICSGLPSLMDMDLEMFMSTSRQDNIILPKMAETLRKLKLDCTTIIDSAGRLLFRLDFIKIFATITYLDINVGYFDDDFGVVVDGCHLLPFPNLTTLVIHGYSHYVRSNVRFLNKLNICVLPCLRNFSIKTFAVKARMLKALGNLLNQLAPQLEVLKLELEHYQQRRRTRQLELVFPSFPKLRNLEIRVNTMPVDNPTTEMSWRFSKGAIVYAKDFPVLEEMTLYFGIVDEVIPKGVFEAFIPSQDYATCNTVRLIDLDTMFYFGWHWSQRFMERVVRKFPNAVFKNTGLREPTEYAAINIGADV